jgi:pimeloyl-ACP methyl ester carboxylesterase
MTKRGERQRDNQQWMLDWLVKTTGRVQNFAYDIRVLPPEVKSYRMIPRVMGKRGVRIEAMARAAEQAGHRETACELYWRAAEHFHEGQHAIFQDDNREKIYLHGKLLECFDACARNAAYTIERVEIPFGDNYIQGVLHLAPGAGKAPTVLFCPGMDMTKESWLAPFAHPFVARGFNCLQMDGPGQGVSNIRKIRVTVDNYERAGTAAIDYLRGRSEIDPERIVVSGFSMGSYWGMRIAATDHRVKAVATAAACYGPKQAIFNEASPRFKQVFMYMSGIHDEEKFDAFAEQMTLDALVPNIKCPSLMVTGEYDALAHLEEVVAVYQKVGGPKELWVLENNFHNPRFMEHIGGMEFIGYLADWLKDALAGRKPANLKREVFIREKDGLGAYTAPGTGLFLPERFGEKNGSPSPAQLGPAGVKAGKHRGKRGIS